MPVLVLALGLAPAGCTTAITGEPVAVGGDGVLELASRAFDRLPAA